MARMAARDRRPPGIPSFCAAERTRIGRVGNFVHT
jgi:hypothetical protein